MACDNSAMYTGAVDESSLITGYKSGHSDIAPWDGTFGYTFVRRIPI